MQDRLSLMRKVVSDETRTFARRCWHALIIFGVTAVLVFLSNSNFADTDYSAPDYESLKNQNAIVNVAGLIVLSYLIYTISRYNRFKNNFLTSVFGIKWAYDNGNVFLMNSRGILNHTAVPPTPVYTTSFKGVSWELDNLKDIAEDVIKNQVGFTSFLPTLKFETKTNIIEPFIPFRNADQLMLVFYDLAEVKLLLLNLVQNKEKAKLTLGIPVPPDVVFGEQEFNRLVDENFAAMKCEATFFYIDPAEWEALGKVETA